MPDRRRAGLNSSYYTPSASLKHLLQVPVPSKTQEIPIQIMISAFVPPSATPADIFTTCAYEKQSVELIGASTLRPVVGGGGLFAPHSLYSLGVKAFLHK